MNERHGMRRECGSRDEDHPADQTTIVEVKVCVLKSDGTWGSLLYACSKAELLDCVLRDGKSTKSIAALARKFALKVGQENSDIGLAVVRGIKVR